MKRINPTSRRTPSYGSARPPNHVVISPLAGIVFLQLDGPSVSLQYRAGDEFFGPLDMSFGHRWGRCPSSSRRPSS